MSKKFNPEIILAGVKELYKEAEKYHRQAELNRRSSEALNKLVEELKRRGAKDTDQFTIGISIDGQGNLACKAIKE